MKIENGNITMNVGDLVVSVTILLQLGKLIYLMGQQSERLDTTPLWVRLESLKR